MRRAIAGLGSVALVVLAVWYAQRPANDASGGIDQATLTVQDLTAGQTAG
jgi:hypothetical protein